MDLSMLSFRKFIIEGIRVGLPSIPNMDHGQFSNLVKGGKVHIQNATEKTDGSTFQFGHDEHGFYSQSSGSGSERMRNPSDYAERATRRSQETGKPLDLTGAHAFAAAHHALQCNQALKQHLKQRASQSGGHTTVRGELFSKALARPSEVPGEVKFVGTSYDPSHMGSVGKIVIHSRLPENQGHDLEHFKKHLSTSEMNFDDDKITHPAAHVDVSKETAGLKGIDHGLLSSRTTPKNKEAKMAEQGKLDTIKKAVSDKVDSAVRSMNIRPKFGSGTEGMVVHPSESNPDAPRFKVTSENFRGFKADKEAQANFKNRLKGPQ